MTTEHYKKKFIEIMLNICPTHQFIFMAQPTHTNLLQPHASDSSRSFKKNHKTLAFKTRKSVNLKQKFKDSL